MYEHGSMGATGEGRSESRRIELRQKVAFEGRSLARVENVTGLQREGFWCS